MKHLHKIKELNDKATTALLESESTRFQRLRAGTSR